MDPWPISERKQVTAQNNKKKGKKKVQDKTTEQPYPRLELGGNLVTLTKVDQQLQWTSITQLNQDHKNFNVYKQGLLFPPTRLVATDESQQPVRHRVEHGANFLRTFLPDLDISSELIRDQLSDDSKYKRQLQHFDADVGNILDFLPIEQKGDPNVYGYLAFPMGELGRELNVSRLMYKNDRGVLMFEPSSLPAKTYQTPIRYITTYKHCANREPLLAIRTFGQLHIEALKPGRLPTAPPSLVEVMVFSRHQTGNKSLVDFTFAFPSSYAVNEEGSIYHFDFNSNQQPNKYTPINTLDEDGGDGFWRVAPLEDARLCACLSGFSLRQVDIRSKSNIELFNIPRKNREIFTSIDKEMRNNFLCVVSTQNIFWLDRRAPGKPLISYKHSREHDRTLDVWGTPWSSGPTLLTSKKNRLITFYDVCRHSGESIYFDSLPSCLSSGPSSISSTVGQVLLPHGPANGKATSASFVSLSDTGALHHVDVGQSNEEDMYAMEASWSSRVKALNRHLPKPKLRPYEEREYAEVNLSEAYDKMFNLWFAEKESDEEGDAEALYELVEAFPRRFQQSEAPVEHIITAYDAVLRSGGDPSHPGRADFLTETIINSTRGYRALEQGRLNPGHLAKIAAWHHDLLPTLRQFGIDATDGISTRVQAFQKYDLLKESDRSFESVKRERQASEQLALDLTLSDHVYSMQTFNEPDHHASLENMTQSLSLASEPPPVRFHYFRPVRQLDGTPLDEFGSPGVRALLASWKVGVDPDQAVRVDQHAQSLGGGELVTDRQERLPAGAQLTRPPVITASQPINPPLVMASVSQQSMLGSQVIFGSQPSQEYASTQILPGVHGGRPQTKKKMAKKRVGGF